MNNKIKAILLGCVLAATAVGAVSCADPTPYETNDAEGYTVSVKYDANGGSFTTNVDTIVDSYNYAELPTNSNGKKELMLISPSDSIRGTGNAYTATNAGYFLAGWYTERTAVVNDKGEALDADGNVASQSGKPQAYTYSGRWDFENGKLQLDPDKTYSSSEPITLYAAWIPEFKFEFISLITGEVIGAYTFDPNYVSDLKLPQWNEATGKLSMEKFPAVEDMTLDGVYLDQNKTQRIESDKIAHTGSFDAETASASAPVMKLYVDYIDGEWYKIYTAEQFVNNASVRGCYEIMADLDFTGLSWKTSLIYGNFRGKIIGNGHVFSNITAEQTDVKRQNAGLFGSLSAGSVIENVTFKNVKFTLKSGTLQQDASLGLFAGILDSGAVLTNLKIEGSELLIDGDANFPNTTSIGLFCGSGMIGSLDISGITCKAVGENAANINIAVDGNDVTVSRAS